MTPDCSILLTVDIRDLERLGYKVTLEAPEAVS